MPANTAYENCLLENRAVSLLENLPSSGWLDQFGLVAAKEESWFWNRTVLGNRVLGRQVHRGTCLSSSFVFSICDYSRHPTDPPALCRRH